VVTAWQSTFPVTIRGIRMFDVNGTEYMGPREPVGTSTQTASGKLANVLGGEQQIAAASAAWSASTMWSADASDPFQWVTIDVRLPDATDLSSLAIYTGYSGSTQYAANKIRLLRRNQYGNYVTLLPETAIGQSSVVSIPSAPKVTHLRAQLRAGASAHVAVRGIRLFTPLGELFTRVFSGRCVRRCGGFLAGCRRAVGALTASQRYQRRRRQQRHMSDRSAMSHDQLLAIQAKDHRKSSKPGGSDLGPMRQI
jgi:hypothetical protein